MFMTKEEVKRVLKVGTPEEIRKTLQSYWKELENETIKTAQEVFEIEPEIGS